MFQNHFLIVYQVSLPILDWEKGWQIGTVLRPAFN